MQAAPLSRLAPATKGEDATKIGVGAGAGAVIGGLLGGKDGARKGAVVGGGAGPVSCSPRRDAKCASDRAPTSRRASRRR